MTQTTDSAVSADKRDGLNKMLMSDLKSLAARLGIKGTASMRKSALVDAIASAQAGGGSTSTSSRRTAGQKAATQAAAATAAPAGDVPQLRGGELATVKQSEPVQKQGDAVVDTQGAGRSRGGCRPPARRRRRRGPGPGAGPRRGRGRNGTPGRGSRGTRRSRRA